MSAAWAAALDAAAASRVTLVVGASDTGKTTLVTRLAGVLAGRGEPVAVVDADLGQSDVGPPTTVGLGRVRGPLTRLAAAELIDLEFLGVTSPAACPRESAEAAGRLARRALDAGFARVLVDTAGLVEGRLGATLKWLEIERLAPDVLLVLQETDECEPILRALPGSGGPAVLRLLAARTTRRSAAVRRQARQQSLRAHLRGARPVTLDLGRVPARPALPGRGPAVVDAAGALVGLEDPRGATLGLGWISAVDPAGGWLTVQTAVDGGRVAAVAIGRERYRAA